MGEHEKRTREESGMDFLDIRTRFLGDTGKQVIAGASGWPIGVGGI